MPIESRDIGTLTDAQGRTCCTFAGMKINTLETWHHIVRSRDATRLDDLLSPHVVFHSPVVHTAITGKPGTLRYLQAAMQVFYNPSFRYIREISNAHEAVLEFEVTLDDTYVNGVDLIRWDHQGRIVDFKAMIRPLKAIQYIHQQMAAMLQAKPRSS